jgi:ActR/RegA family two-component response regulator
MDQTTPPGAQSSERREADRVWVPGVAVLRNGLQAPSVWRVSNLSSGGTGLVGDGSIMPGRQAVSLHVAGFPALELAGTILRQQLVKRGGRCALRFVDLTDAQRRALAERTAAEHAPSLMGRRALVVTPDTERARTTARELARLGFAVREESSPGQAVAWLQREETELLLADESVIEADKWSLLQFVRDTAPEIRRLVLANDVRGFRLYYAMKAGLVDGLVEPTAAGDALARHLVGAPAAQKPAKRHTAR